MTGLRRFDTLRARLAFGGALLLLGAIVIAVVGVMGLGALGTTATREVRALMRSASLSVGMLGSLTREIRAAEQYFSDRSGDARDVFRAAAESTVTYQRRLRALSALSAKDHALVNRLDTLQADVEVRYSYAHALADLGRSDQALRAAAAARASTSELTQALREFSATQASRADSAARSLVSTARDRQTIVFGILAISLLLGIWVGLATLRSVRAALLDLAHSAKLVSEGDLRPAPMGAVPDELTDLAQAMARISTRLRSIVAQVVSEGQRISGTATDLSAVSQEIAASASHVSTAMVEVSSGAAKQAGQLEESAKAAERLRGASQLSADVAARVSHLGGEIRRLAGRHQEDVSTASATLLDAATIVQTSAVQVEELDRHSQSIDDFVDLIRRISSQTNLLALNAAIEAARAGERGHGFAVVADEVRQLADTSSAAAEEVTEAIRVIRAQIAEVASTMAQGRAKVYGAERVAQGAAKALEEIVRAVSEVEYAAQRVAEEAVDNLRAAEVIQRLVGEAQGEAQSHAASSQEVTAATQQQGASTQEMAAQAGELALAAERLQGLVREFRV